MHGQPFPTPDASGADTITTSPAALSAAFERWETSFRADPAEFLSQEEIRAMEVAPLSEQRAIYFAGLLRSAA